MLGHCASTGDGDSRTKTRTRAERTVRSPRAKKRERHNQPTNAVESTRLMTSSSQLVLMTVLDRATEINGFGTKTCPAKNQKHNGSIIMEDGQVNELIGN